MSRAERLHNPDVSEAANDSLRKRRNRISRWLMTRGISAAAIGTLGVAGYLAIAGGTAAAVVTAPLFVTIAGATAVVGGSLLFAGLGKRMIDSVRA